MVDEGEKLSNMKNKEKINHIELIQKAINLAIKIQNKGIATVFVDLSGHCGDFSISIHEPVWYAGHEPEKLQCYIEWKDSLTSMNKMIKRLTEIADKPAIDEDEQNRIISEEVKQRKMAQYLTLKKEFEGTV